jgi:cobalt-zinc-cadmium efflux system outer membrane protein
MVIFSKSERSTTDQFIKRRTGANAKPTFLLALMSIVFVVRLASAQPPIHSEAQRLHDDSQSSPIGRAQAEDTFPPQRAITTTADISHATADLGDSTGRTLPATRLTLEQAILWTLDNHPRLRARRQEVEVARSKLISASLLPNPKIVGNVNAALSEDKATTISGRLMFTVPTNHKMARAQNAADAGIVEANLAVDSEVYLLLSGTIDAALKTLYYQELVEIYGQLGRLTEEAADIEHNRAQLRGLPPTQIIAADINAVEADLNRLDNESELELAELRLSRAMGMPHPQLISIEGNLAVEPLAQIPLDDLLRESERKHPELAQAEAAIAKSRLYVDSARANSVPSVEIGPRVRLDLTNDAERIGVRLDSDLPLFDRKEGEIYGAESAVHVKQARCDEVRLASQHDVANAYQQLRDIEATLVEYDERVLPLNQRTEKLLKDAKELQLFDVPKINDALRQLGEIKCKHARLRYEHKLIRAHLDLLLGRKLDVVVPPTSPDGVAPSKS